MGKSKAPTSQKKKQAEYDYRVERRPLPFCDRKNFEKLVACRQDAGAFWAALTKVHAGLRRTWAEQHGTEQASVITYEIKQRKEESVADLAFRTRCETLAAFIAPRLDEGKWPTSFDLNSAIRGVGDFGFMLNINSLQSLIREFVQVVDGTTANRREQKASGKEVTWVYPWRKRRSHVCSWNRKDVTVTDDGVLLSLGIERSRENGKTVNRRREPLFIPLQRVPRNLSELSITFDVTQGFILVLKTRERKKVMEVSGSTAGHQAASLDPGQIRMAALATERGSYLNVNGRGLLTLQQESNRLQSHFAERISFTQDGSHRRRKLVMRKRKVLGRIQFRIDNVTHHASRRIANFCEAEKVSALFAGNPEGVKTKDVGKRQNQRNHNWNRGRLYETIGIPLPQFIMTKSVQKSDSKMLKSSVASYPLFGGITDG